MLTVNFKNVGQGDSIFLSWESNDKTRKYGIIDCVLHHGKIDSIKSHLLNNDIQRIEWIIISHPHTDHCSGVLALLNFCLAHKIEIGSIFHTAAFSKGFMKSVAGFNRNKIIRSMVNVDQEADQLLKMFVKIGELHQNKTVSTKGKVLIDGVVLDLNKDMRLRVLAPTGYDELQDYLNKTFDVETGELLIPLSKQKRRNNPNANLFSSCIVIESSNWQLVFPSDCLTKTLKRIQEESDVSLDKVRLLQIPHHGSKNGHCLDFLESIPAKKMICAIVSVGTNSYGHPVQEVIDYYYHNFSEVHSTNFVGRMEEVQNDFENLLKEFNALLIPEKEEDTSLQNETEFAGEKKFQIDANGYWKVDTIL